MSSAFGFKSDDTSSIGTSIHGSRSPISFDSAGMFRLASGRPQEDTVRRSLDDDVANQDERPYSPRDLQSKREIGTRFRRSPSLRTTGSSNSNAAPENPVREAVTTSRAIVKLTKSGVVSAGTLEGFVERLTSSFSASYLNSSVLTLLIVLRRFTAGHRICRHTVDGVHRFYDPGRFIWGIISALLRRRTVEYAPRDEGHSSIQACTYPLLSFYFEITAV